MKKPPKKPPESLGPQFWAIMRHDFKNPYVSNGKVTEKGLKHLEETETMRVRAPGLRGVMGEHIEMTRAEYWDEYLRRLRASR